MKIERKRNFRRLFFRQMFERMRQELRYILHPRTFITEIKWLLWPPTHIFVWLFSGFFMGTIFFVYFCLYHRPRLIIKTPIRFQHNMIIVANHLTLLDSVFIGVILFYPLVIFRPSLIPIHLAAVENFFQPNLPKKWIRNGAALGGWLAKLLQKSLVEKFLNEFTNTIATATMRLLRVYAVQKGRKDPRLARRINRDIKRNIAVIFITRGRDVSFIKSGIYGRDISDGIGLWALNNNSEVVIAYHQGLERVESVKRGWVRKGQRDLTLVVDYLNVQGINNRKAMVAKCALAIQNLRKELQEGLI